MNSIKADVVIFDTIGTPYTTKTMYESGMGGSEFQCILLLKKLQKIGKKVVCINNTSQIKIDEDILYLPVKEYKNYDIKCNNLIIHRMSEIPKIPHKKAFIWVTDLNGPHTLGHYNLLNSGKVELISLCKFHNDLFPSSWNKHIIPFIIPDEVYNYSIPEKSGYIYASSLMKGYGATNMYWKYLKNEGMLKGKTLSVCLPGYDNPVGDLTDKTFDINYLGSLPFKKVIEVIAKSEGMFYVNVMPETFGISVVLAEILNCTPIVYGINGLGSLPQVLKGTQTLVTDMKEFIDIFKYDKVTPKTDSYDYRPNTVIKKWLEILK